MSVLDILAGEHVLFRKLIAELRHVLCYDEETARREARDVLLLLLPALEHHEELEDLVFPTKSESGRARPKIIAELNKEHWRIALLRTELLDALRDSGKLSAQEFRQKTVRLAALLLEHFEVEETKLWSRFRELCAKDTGGSTERRARERLTKLLREVERRRALTTESEGHIL